MKVHRQIARLTLASAATLALTLYFHAEAFAGSAPPLGGSIGSGISTVGTSPGTGAGAGSSGLAPTGTPQTGATDEPPEQSTAEARELANNIGEALN